MDLTMPMRCPKGHLSTDAEYCSECGAKMPDAASGLGVAVGASLPGAGTALSGNAAPGDSDRVCPDCGTPRANPTAVFCEVCRYNFVTHTSWAAPKVSTPQAAPAAAPHVPPQASGPVFADAAASVTAAAAPTAPPAPDIVAPDALPAALPDAASVSDVDPLQSPPFPIPSGTGGSNANGLTQSPILRWEAVVAVDPSLYTDPDPQIPCPVGEPERVYPLDFAENLIGRRSEKRDIHPEINLNDACASHRHAKIQRQPDGAFALLDVGSTNGTQLNGVEVQPAVRTPLQDGDQITLGCWTRITIRGIRG